MSHQCRNVLRFLAVLFALGASAFADSALYSADAAGGGRSGGGGRGGMRAGGIAGVGHLSGPRGHGVSIGAAGGLRGSFGHRFHRGTGGAKGLHPFRTPFAGSHMFRHRSTVFVNVTGLVHPYYSHYPYYAPYPPYGYYPTYLAYPGYDYPVEYPQSAGTYAYAATDNVQVYAAPPEPTPTPLPRATERTTDRALPQGPPGDGSLNVQVSPPEAEIRLDGQYIGEAHEVARIAEVPVAAGRHLLDIRVGSERTFMDVVVSPGRSTPVRLALDAPGVTPAALSQENGVLRVQVSPTGAAIYVNGAFAAIAAAAEAVPFRLPSGRHHVQIVLPGYNGYDAKVTVPERGEEVLAVQLIPE